MENDETPTQHPAPKPHSGIRPLDLVAVTAAEARWLARIGLDEDGIAALAAEILAKAATVVIDPTAYVIGTIGRSRPEWEKRAYAITLDPPIATELSGARR